MVAHTRRIARPQPASTRARGPGRRGALRAGAFLTGALRAAGLRAGALAGGLRRAGAASSVRAGVRGERLPPLELRDPDAVLEEDDRAAEPFAGEVALEGARVGAGVLIAMRVTLDPAVPQIT